VAVNLLTPTSLRWINLSIAGGKEGKKKETGFTFFPACRREVDPAKRRSGE
jgi:hypothetical protein